MLKVARIICALGAASLLALNAAIHDASADEAAEAWARGNAACLAGDFGLAIRHYSDSIRLDPKYVAAFNNRGYAYSLAGNVDKSIADYNEALRLDPNYAKAHFFRGSQYETRGDWDKAVADYSNAIRIDPRYARMYCDRGLAAKPSLAAANVAQASQNPHDAPLVSELFVAPNGDDGNPGTIERPFATLYRAHQEVRAGQTISLRAGAYQAMISWTKSGAPAAPITIQAYRGENVVLLGSEQYDWTRVIDPAFGECWKVVVPNLQIRYPGVQHTVWEDAVAAATAPGIHVWAIVKGGYMCAPMNAANDFAHPQSAPGLPLTDARGELLYDITWFDQSTKTLWFKPGPSCVNDPSRQLYVTSASSGQFSATASYLRLSGLKFEYLFFIHQQDNPTGCDIANCEIKHAGQGIVGGGRRCTYTSLLIDKVGDWLTWRNSEYERGYLAHCIYFNGSRCVVANCFFGRSNKGGPIHNYPDGMTENVFDGNVLYHSDGGSIFMGSGRNYIANNISLQKTYGMGPYVSMQGFTFANNYSEAANPFNFACVEKNGAYSGTFERFAITGNVFNNTGGFIECRGNIVDAKSCRIDGNVYLGTQHWSMGLTQANPPTAIRHDCNSYKSYVAALQSLPNCAAWEKESQADPVAPQFDFDAFDSYLDTNPPLADVVSKIGRYVKGVVARIPEVGPATSREATHG